MDVDRDTLVEIVAAFGPVLVMIAVVVTIGSQYAATGGLSPDGGWALLGAIVAFVLAMTVIGLALARSGVSYTADGDGGADDADDAPESDGAAPAGESAE